MSDINTRKQDHINVIRHDKDVDRRKYYFDDIRLTHRALPEIDFQQIDPAVQLLNRSLSFPLIISCMTGGSGHELSAINHNLAQAAQLTGIGIGTGSMRVALEDPQSLPSFQLRDVAPDILLCGNLGAVQLNHGVGPDELNTLIRQTGIDALYLHLNPLQEAIQPEGQTNFSHLLNAIQALTHKLDCPVMIKEVGCGINLTDATRLKEAGVHVIDVAGAGGTSWSRIEQARRQDSDALGLCFQDWGIPTPQALVDLAPLRHEVTLIASGGIRTGIEMAKAMILGASCCGIARPFIEAAETSVDAVVTIIERLRREFQTAMFLLGCQSVSELIGNTNLISHTPYRITAS